MKRMQDGDPTVNLDHREIFEKRDIQGDWKFELVARTPQVFQEGDLWFGFSGGGPGYGDPLERQPEVIAEDLKKKIVSAWTAANIYKVAFDSEGRKIDQARTEELRAEERKARIARGKPYAEFVAEWEKKSPPPEILQFYGTWPDAKSTGPVFRP